MLINQFGLLPLSIPKTYAADGDSKTVTQKVTSLLTPKKSHTELNLVAILVEDKLLNDKIKYKTKTAKSTLKSHIYK